MIIKKKVYTDKPHVFDKPIYEKEAAKAIAADFNEPYDPDLSSFDFITARMSANKGLDIVSEPVSEQTKNVKCKDHYVPVKLYAPKDAADRYVLFIHGGGFISGKVTDKDAQCRYLAVTSRSVVAAIEYRLSPECMFPGALEDCVAVLEWIGTLNPEKIIIGGDSAGANLSVATCLKSNVKVDYMFLQYAALDLETVEETDYHWSYDFYEMDETQKPVICNRLLRFVKLAKIMKKAYIPEGVDVRNELVSPLYSARLGELPPVLLIEPEFDYYRPCNEEFARRIRTQGGQVEEIFYEGMDHAFMDHLGKVPQVQDALDEISKRIREL